MKLCATLLSAHLVSAAPNHDSDRYRRQSAGSSGSIVSWDGLQHPDGWEPDCALRATGKNHVPGVCTQYYECVNGQPTGAFNAIVRNCGPQTFWHSGLQICGFAWQANCDAAFRQPVTTTTTTTTTEAPTTTTTEAPTTTTTQAPTTTTTEAPTTTTTEAPTTTTTEAPTTTTTEAPTTTTTEAPTTTTTEAPTSTTTEAQTTTTTEAPTTTTTEVPTTTTTPAPLAPFIINIDEMAAFRLDGANGIPFVADFIDYGCAGRGNFDAFSKTLGRQVDSVDKLFYKWKKCIQCATGKDAGMVIDYQFNPNTKSCASSTDESRPICECDHQLVDALINGAHFNAAYTNYDGSLCVQNSPLAPTRAQCCYYDTFMFASFNPDKSCCSSIEGVKQAGTC